MDEITHAKTGRRALLPRLVTLTFLAVVAIAALVACGPSGDKPYSTTSPAAEQASKVQDLYKLVFWLSLVVFVGVQFAIVYISLRYRRKKSDVKRPPQIHGNPKIEIIWTVIPAIVLLVLMVPTMTLIFEDAANAEDPDIQIDVFGKQWWWEFHLQEDDAQGGQNLGVVTANEIYVPVGRNIVFNLQSNNVIHSFWVPQLSGKMDVIPGHINRLSITPTETGEFYGECAEYCGAQHAWMRFKINVVPQDEFYAWVNNWRSAPQTSVNVTGDGIVAAPDTFAICLTCHRVNGSDGPELPEGINAPANLGPNLTMVACRESIAAGALENTPENLRKWLTDPGAVKPGNYMARMIGPDGQIQLTDEQITELVDYLYSMQPAGGCSSPAGWGTPGASPAATPPASPVATPER